MRDQALGTGCFGGESIFLPPIIATSDWTQAAHIYQPLFFRIRYPSYRNELLEDAKKYHLIER